MSFTTYAVLVLFHLCHSHTCNAAAPHSSFSLHQGYTILRGKVQQPQTTTTTTSTSTSTALQSYHPGYFSVSTRKLYPSNAPRISPLALPTIRPVPCLANKRFCRSSLQERNENVLIPLQQVQTQLRQLFDQIIATANATKRRRFQRRLKKLHDLEKELLDAGTAIFNLMQQRGCFPCEASPSPTPTSSNGARRCKLITGRLKDAKQRLQRIEQKIKRLRKILKGKTSKGGKNKRFFNKELRKLLEKEEQVEEEEGKLKKQVLKKGCK